MFPATPSFQNSVSDRRICFHLSWVNAGEYFVTVQPRCSAVEMQVLILWEEFLKKRGVSCERGVSWSWGRLILPTVHLLRKEGNLLSWASVLLCKGAAGASRTKDPSHFYSAHMPVYKRGAVTGEQEGGEQESDPHKACHIFQLIGWFRRNSWCSLAGFCTLISRKKPKQKTKKLRLK